jgi:hypothetical protein
MAATETMEEWLRALLHEPRCMDCKRELAEGEGTREFRGPLPQVDFIGRLCEGCWQWRDTLRRLRLQSAGKRP